MMSPCVRLQHPHAVLALVHVVDAAFLLDLRALDARALGIGLRRAGRVEMALDRVPQSGEELLVVEDGELRLGVLRRHHFQFHAHVAPARPGVLHRLDAFLRLGKLHAAGDVHAAGLAGKLLDLLVELHRVLLHLGDVRIAVEGVEAARRMPGGAGGQHVALQQADVGPAALCKVVENRAADYAAADDNRAILFAHAWKLPSNAGKRRSGDETIQCKAGPTGTKTAQGDA